MTQTQPQDPLDQAKGVSVDPISAANAIGSLLSAMSAGDTSTPAGSPTVSGDPFANLSSTPVTPTQTAATTDAMSTGSRTANAAGEVDPVPQGTPVTQGYGGAGGHPGVDLGVPVGTTIVSAISGRVTVAGNSDPGGYGNEVEVTGPNGIATRYGHLSMIGVKQGDTVKAGQPIGKSGGIQGAPGSGNSKGPHLHFEVDGPGGTMDPLPYLAGGAQIIAGTPSTGGTSTPAAPEKPVTQEAASATAVQRATDLLGGLGDPGSPNQAPAPTTTGQAVSSGATTGKDNDPGAIDAFLNATKQHESGGNYTIFNTSGQSNASGAYQFLGSTWGGYGGYPNAASAPPAVQDAKAREMASALFNQFHSWRLVAIAWYGGPGVAQQVAAGQDPGSPQGQGGYLAYGNTIAGMMGGK